MMPYALQVLRTLALAGFLAGPGCGAPDPEAPATVTVVALDYDVLRPDTVLVLQDALDEVSGLTVLLDGRLAAVEDERGIVYVLDEADGRIVSRHRFHGKGDFEGIEALPDGRLFVLRSDGDLFEIPSLAGVPVDGDLDAERHETKLDQPCDAEGLGYDRAANRLLVACKERGRGGDKDVRRVFAFDPDAMETDPEVRLEIDLAAVDAELDLESRGSSGAIKPSGVAMHPRTGHLYVLSSSRPALLVFDSDGTLVGSRHLPLRQPEGIAFAPDATLYITTEAASDEPALLRYLPRPSAAGAPERPSGPAPSDSSLGSP